MRKIVYPAIVLGLVASLGLNAYLLSTPGYSDKGNDLVMFAGTEMLRELLEARLELQKAKEAAWLDPAPLLAAAYSLDAAARNAIYAETIMVVAEQQTQEAVTDSLTSELWPILNTEVSFLIRQSNVVQQGGTPDIARLDNLTEALSETGFPIRIRAIEDWSDVEAATRAFIKRYSE